MHFVLVARKVRMRKTWSERDDWVVKRDGNEGGEAGSREDIRSPYFGLAFYS